MKASGERREHVRKPHDRTARATGHRGLTTTDCRGAGRRGLGIWANRVTVHTGGPSSAPSFPRRGWGGQRRVTPRQTCPRPNGFGRNLRSKTRWFTGFCNSHQVSHFATFFIDARAEISVAESRLDILKMTDRPHIHRLRDGGGTLFHSSSLAQYTPVFGTPGRVTSGRSKTFTSRDRGEEP